MKAEISTISPSKPVMAFLPYFATMVSSTLGVFAWVVADVLLNAWQVYDGYGSLGLVEFLYWAGVVIVVAELLVYGVVSLFTKNAADWVKTHYIYQRKILVYSLGAKVLIFGVILIIGQPLTFDMMGEVFPLVTDPEMATPGFLTGIVIATSGTWGLVSNSVPNEGLSALIGTWAVITGFATGIWISGLAKNSIQALTNHEAIRS